MTLAASKKSVTPEEYLGLEEAALDKHEYHAGEILAMSGGTYRHSRVIMNFGIEIGLRLKGSPCFPLDSNMRLRLAQSNRYVYPDVMIVCGAPIFDPLDLKQTTIINPKVVIEVLSESTEAYDRGEKFSAYRDLPSMEEYVLVSQNRPTIETFLRQSGGSWLFSAWNGADQVAALRSVAIDVSLSEVYASLTFES